MMRNILAPEGITETVRDSENPLAFNITQTKKEQHYAKCPENSEIKCEGHYMIAFDRPLKNINSVSHRQYKRKWTDKYGK